ncbi:hypothetical protein HZ326_25060 [Fusarium oxysporum f. sp. albedinis]|nr:hypothetical protein HZ326_25060 [Fusarium oxysporum f. sp. albedinis]
MDSRSLMYHRLSRNIYGRRAMAGLGLWSFGGISSQNRSGIYIKSQDKSRLQGQRILLQDALAESRLRQYMAYKREGSKGANLYITMGKLLLLNHLICRDRAALRARATISWIRTQYHRARTIKSCIRTLIREVTGTVGRFGAILLQF